jgi:UDP-N-acetylglucosamine:LPS N-acetylglucosamine transferase
MDLLLTAADLLVGRAGGTTVAELAEVGLPGLLVPLPIAPRDHQTANAAALVGAGAAILVPDAELDGARIVRELQPLLDDPARLAAMGAAARSLAHPDAAARVADLVEANARG